MQTQEIAGKCVLIVEANPLNRNLFAAMVAAQGYGVLQASDGPHGIDLAHREQPDLIVMDINLPGMSGLEATGLLKEDRDTRGIPVIMTAAQDYGRDDPEIRACGCDSFMAKPIGVMEFIESIGRFMRKSGSAPRCVCRLVEPTALD